MTKATLLLILTVILNMGFASAGEVQFQDNTRYFELSVSVKSSPSAPSKKLDTDQSGNFSFSFDESTFDSNIYNEKIFIVDLTPKEENIPARGVQKFSVEIPILLRRWRENDTYLLKVWDFAGVGEKILRQHESLKTPEQQWERLFASLQLADHYQHRVRSTVPESLRAYNTAVAALLKIATNSEISWLMPPTSLSERVGDSAARNENKKFELLASIDQVNGLLWRDLLRLGTHFENFNCESVRNATNFLDNRSYRLEAAFNTQVNERSFLENKISIVTSEACE